MQYLDKLESLVQLISACRSGDWQGYVAALENNIKYFFAHDHLKLCSPHAITSGSNECFGTG